MYVGRIVVIGKLDKPFVGYRVSSRSFPNRIASIKKNSVKILYKGKSKNPFVTYNCIKKKKNFLIVSNGHHTDAIAKELGPPLETLAKILSKMGYEEDEYKTPRIAGIVDLKNSQGYLGIAREDGVFVKKFDLEKNKLFFLCTYKLNEPSEKNSVKIKEKDIANFLIESKYFRKFENPVCSGTCYKNRFSVKNVK